MLNIEVLMEDLHFYDIMCEDIIQEGLIDKLRGKDKTPLTKVETIALVIGGTILAIPIAIMSPILAVGYITLKSIHHNINDAKKTGKLNNYNLSDILTKNKNKISKIEYPKDLKKYSDLYCKSVIKISKSTYQLKELFISTNEKNYKSNIPKLEKLQKDINDEYNDLEKKLNNISKKFIK